MHDVLDKLNELTGTQRIILHNQANQQKAIEKNSNLLESQGETLLRNTITVEDHVRRSNMLETRQDALEDKVENLKDKIEIHENNKKYLKSLMVGVGYVVTAASTLMGMLWGIYQIMQKLGM